MVQNFFQGIRRQHCPGGTFHLWSSLCRQRWWLQSRGLQTRESVHGDRYFATYPQKESDAVQACPMSTDFTPIEERRRLQEIASHRFAGLPFNWYCCPPRPDLLRDPRSGEQIFSRLQFSRPCRFHIFPLYLLSQAGGYWPAGPLQGLLYGWLGSQGGKVKNIAKGTTDPMRVEFILPK